MPKTHPRIAFRGMMDLLEAEIMLCQLAAPDQKAQLEELLGFARMIVRCDVLEEPFGVDRLCGLTEDALRQRSHRPQDYYGQAHFMPGVGDGEEILRLNRLRCVARQAELAAVDAFSDREGRPTRPDILKAMNRMSSMVWIMMIEKKKQL